MIKIRWFTDAYFIMHRYQRHIYPKLKTVSPLYQLAIYNISQEFSQISQNYRFVFFFLLVGINFFIRNIIVTHFDDKDIARIVCSRETLYNFKILSNLLKQC